jgi:hypothetical protein
MSFYNYAKLGHTCNTSASVLTSNTKFFSLSDKVYSIFPTNMMQYPGSRPRMDDLEGRRLGDSGGSGTIATGEKSSRGKTPSKVVKKSCCGK